MPWMKGNLPLLGDHLHRATAEIVERPDRHERTYHADPCSVTGNGLTKKDLFIGLVDFACAGRTDLPLGNECPTQVVVHEYDQLDIARSRILVGLFGHRRKWSNGPFDDPAVLERDLVGSDRRDQSPHQASEINSAAARAIQRLASGIRRSLVSRPVPAAFILASCGAKST